MSKFTGKIVEWSLGSVVGNTAWTAAVSIALFMVNRETGCISVVLDQMAGHEVELAGWTASFALAGAMVAAAPLGGGIQVRRDLAQALGEQLPVALVHAITSRRYGIRSAAFRGQARLT